jgi:1-acyl-sn-glycerol-3-phosphate acyltransferase
MTWLRSLIFNIYFYGLTVIFAVSSLAGRALGLGGTPVWAMSLARRWAKSVLAGLGPICGITYVVTGTEHLPRNAPGLVASNHQSAFDTMVWLTLLHQPAYVLKQELMRIPLFGALCRLSGMIAVDRGAGASAIRTLLRAADTVKSENRVIVIFPEGTRVPPGQVGELHPGVAALASRTKLPVIPVVTDSGKCWGRRAFKKIPGVIRIDIQPPLPAGLRREELMERLEAIYVAGVRGPVDKSVGDAAGALIPGRR